MTTEMLVCNICNGTGSLPNTSRVCDGCGGSGEVACDDVDLMMSEVSSPDFLNDPDDILEDAESEEAAEWQTIGGRQFPANAAAAEQWKPDVRIRSLHHGRIAAVARTTVAGKWRAYIGLVPSIFTDHDDPEVIEYLLEGNTTPLVESIARGLFPTEFADLKYWG